MISMQLQGMEGLQAQLVELGAELGAKTLAAAARRAMKPVLDTARSLVPVLSGDLRDALRLTVVKPDAGDAVVAVGITISSQSARGKAIKAAVKKAVGGEAAAKGLKVTRVSVSGGGLNELPPSKRWWFIELGTVKLAAHPFLRPALDQNVDVVLSALKEELAQGIERAVKKAAR